MPASLYGATTSNAVQPADQSRRSNLNTCIMRRRVTSPAFQTFGSLNHKLLYAQFSFKIHDIARVERADADRSGKNSNMSEDMIAEALQLMTSMSQNDIKDALHRSFKGPPISERAIGGFIAKWKSPEARLQRYSMGEPIVGKPPTLRVFETYHTYEDGTQAGFEFDYILKPKVDMPIRPEVDAEMLWKDFDYLTKAGQRADAFLKAVDKLDTLTEKIDVLMKAAEKCGIPRTKAELAAKNGNIENTIKVALTLKGVKAACINGAWQSAALTAVFDIKKLFDGQFRQYLFNIGLSGLYGSAVGGLSAWVNHPFFGNGIVLGVVVGSAFGAVSLASTGDWARFGKDLGVNILGSAAAWGGASAGALVGASLGPLGAAAGAVVGGICAGLATRNLATSHIPTLGGRTDHEVNTMYEAIARQLASAGLEPDPSLSHRQVVEAFMAQGTGVGVMPFKVRMTDAMASNVGDLRQKLLDLQELSPEAFEVFLNVLRAHRSMP